MNRFIVLLLSLLFVGRLSAQNIEYGVQLDTTYMLIGEQQRLTFRVKTDQPLRIQFPALRDTVVSGVEIVNGPVRDSVKAKDGSWLYEASYTITVFDTGVYIIPQMPIVVETDNYNNVLRTDSIGLVVNTYEVDQNKGNYDIVTTYNTPWTFAEVLPYVLWTILALLVVGGGVWLVRRYRSHKPIFHREEVVVPPYDTAIRLLNQLKEEKLWQAGRVKEYYTKLTDALRQYISGELGVAAMERTSFEIVRDMERCDKVEADDREALSALLETADFVKFAKASPLPDENGHNMDVAYQFVNHTNERIKLSQQPAEEERVVVGQENATGKGTDPAFPKSNV